MNKNLIVKISQGLGNQLFMYSNAYALSKKIGYNLLIDNTSSYYKNKDQYRNFLLDKFDLDLNIAEKKFKHLKKIDYYKKKKSFIIENKNKKKITSYSPINNINNFSNTVFIEGFFESEKYFLNVKNELQKKIIVKDSYINNSNKFVSLLQNTNSVSICVRQHRYSEGKTKSILKSNDFTKITIDYILRSVNFIKTKIENPKFFVWSNDFTNLKNYFTDDFIFIDNNENKFLNDFNLFKYSKHFIIGPTTFHWWGAWLNTNDEKICIRPKNINNTNNINYWPDDWISL